MTEVDALKLLYSSFEEFIKLLDCEDSSELAKNVVKIGKVILPLLQLATNQAVIDQIKEFIVLIIPYYGAIIGIAASAAALAAGYWSGKQAFKAMTKKYEPEVYRIKLKLEDIENKFREIETYKIKVGELLLEVSDACFNRNSPHNKKAKIFALKSTLQHAKLETDYCYRQLKTVQETIETIREGVEGVRNFLAIVGTIVAVLACVAGCVLLTPLLGVSGTLAIAGAGVFTLAGTAFVFASWTESSKELNNLKLQAEKAANLKCRIENMEDYFKLSLQQLNDVLAEVNPSSAAQGLQWITINSGLV